MISADVNGHACWLIPHTPNTDDTVRVGVTLPVSVLRGLTGPTLRRPQALTLQLSLEWTATITAAAFAAARNATQVAQAEPVLVPAWPFAVPAAAALPVTSGLTIAWTRDWSAWAINPADFAGYAFKAPLLRGELTRPPRFAGKNGEHVLAEFFFEEDGPADYAITPPAAADATLATVSGYAAPVFPWIHEGSTPPAPGAAVVDVERSQSGPGRIKSKSFYPQLPERVLEASFKFTSAAAAAGLLGWWARRAGGSEPHWVAETQSLGRLAANVAAGSTVLDFARPLPPLGINRAIALSHPGALEYARVANVAGARITTAAPLAQAWPAQWTNVTLAMLARHVDEEFVLEFRRANTGWVADTTLRWRECSPEYTVPAGETRGATVGRLPAAWWGFQIDLDYSGAIETTRLTNWESGDVVVADELWAYNDCGFTQLVQSTDLEDTECTFKLRWWSGCPWENWLPGRLAATGRLTIYRADVSPAREFSNFRQVWSGDISTPKRNGGDYDVKVVGANALFSRKHPQQKVSTSCGTHLFSPRCGLLVANWTFSARIVQVASPNVVLDTFARTNGGALPAGFGFADWFALGYVEWQQAGRPLRTGVLANSALAGGAMTVGVNRMLGWSVGDTVTLVPGCDRQGFTCRAHNAATNEWGKFGNYANFRGFEFTPAVAPNFVIPPRATAPAKK